MKVSLWAEIRRLAEIEKLSARVISRRLHCSWRTVAIALEWEQPPAGTVPSRGSGLDPYKAKIDALLAKYPELSAVRVHEEIARGPDRYTGSVITVRRYVRSIRPARGRVDQEVHYEPAQAMQVDWGECGRVQVGNTNRKVSVLVAVLCYSRMTYIEFTLSQRKAEFYRCLVHALEFFGASPRAIIFDNLKTAVINGSGRAACFHPEFLALCGHYYLQPIACERRDPESKGIVEAKVRYVKHNALAGRGDELVRFEDYVAFAPRWRDEIANVRTHETTRERPVDRFQQERSLLRALPTIPFDTDEIVLAVVSPHARVEFDANRYSVPPRLVRQTVTIRADGHEVRILHQGKVVAQHARCYQRRQLIVLPDHRLAALTPLTRTLMARRDENLQARIDRDLAALKLPEIAKSYREVLDEAARKGSSFLEVLAILIGLELAAREQRALERRLREARLPKLKTLAEYDFRFPKRIPKAAILRLFDCDFIEQHGCAVLIGSTGTGKSHLLTALGYTAVERGHSVRHTRVVDMINQLTAAQLNGSLGATLRSYIRPSLLLLDELGYLPIDKHGADLLFQIVAARYEVGSIVITTNRPFREWGRIFDVDNTLATALIDSAEGGMHHGEGIVIEGDSYRMRDKDPDSTDE